MARKITLATLVEKKKPSGEDYFVGRMGPVRVMLERDPESDPGTWMLRVQEIVVDTKKPEDS